MTCEILNGECTMYTYIRYTVLCTYTVYTLYCHYVRVTWLLHSNRIPSTHHTYYDCILYHLLGYILCIVIMIFGFYVFGISLVSLPYMDNRLYWYLWYIYIHMLQSKNCYFMIRAHYFFCFQFTPSSFFCAASFSRWWSGCTRSGPTTSTLLSTSSTVSSSLDPSLKSSTSTLSRGPAPLVCPGSGPSDSSGSSRSQSELTYFFRSQGAFC